jgi:hypothetical protein
MRYASAVGEKRKRRITVEDHTLITPISPETRAGVPASTPAADTNPITITHDGVRGIAYQRGGHVQTGNCISGTIATGCHRARKTP